jgi:outer membrane receptor protein involved in Fe transport
MRLGYGLAFSTFALLRAVADPATDAEPPGAAPLAGLSVEQAIAALERTGLTIFYSSDLVRPAMRVKEEPAAAADPQARLQEILAPFGLATRLGPRDSVLIVRAPRASPAALQPVVAAASPPPPPQPTIDEIVVTASQYEINRDVGASVITMTGADLENLPDLGDDALRAVHRLPGAASNGFSARPNVRGGDVGETLVRFDELRLYDPFHLESFQGVFSGVDPRIVSSMDVYTGAFPAIFGDRMSGVIDVSSLGAPKRRYHEIAMSFFNASVLSSGLFRNGGEWVASARRSNLDLLYSALSDHPERPRYLDAFAKVSYRLSDKLRLTANTLYFRDDISLSDDVDVEEHAFSNDEDRYIWLRLDHTTARRLSGSTLLARSRLDNERRGTTEQEGVSTGSMDDRRDFAIDSMQSDWAWQPSETVHVQFGALASRMRGNYDYRDQVEFALLFDTPGAPTEAERERAVALEADGRQQAVYTTARVNATPRLTVDLGVRWDRQTLDPAHTTTLGPRLGLRYQLAPRTLFRLSWGKVHQSQAVNELQVADGVDRFSPPQRSDHAVIGFEHALPLGVSLRLEAYEKDIASLLPRYENLLNSRTLLPELKPDRILVAPDAASARGLELLVTGREDAATRWWAAYSRSRAEDRVDGGDVLRSWDQTRTLSGGVSRDTLKWSFSLGAVYRTGWPTTPVELDASGELPIVVAGARNSTRVSAFRSVDLRLTRKFATREGSLAAFLELTNVFDHGNRCCTEYEIELTETGEPILDLSALNYLPLVPSLGFVWSF